MIASPSGQLRGTGLVACLVAFGLTLAACEGLKEQFGVGKNAPDEFAVVARAPLSLPPDYSLRPPAPGTPRPQQTSAQEKAKAALYGSASRTQSAGRRTPGERALLARAGAASARPDIRRILNEENALYAEGDESFVDALIFWQGPPRRGVVVDAAKEAQRLQETSALGKPATAGQTAVIKRRRKGMLEGIF